MLQEALTRINNFFYVVDALRSDEFFCKLLFKPNRKSITEVYMDGWLNREVGTVSSLVHAVYLSDNIKSQIYAFNDKTAEQYSVGNKQEAKRIITEIDSVLTLAKKFTSTDITASIKEKLYLYVLNGFLVKMCHVYYKYRPAVHKFNIFKRMRSDFMELEGFFLTMRKIPDNQEIARDMDRFRTLMFETDALEDNEADKLAHFVYKLKNKRKSIFG